MSVCDEKKMPETSLRGIIVVKHARFSGNDQEAKNEFASIRPQ